MYYDAAAALLAEIRTCMGGDSCDYAMYVSLGAPVAACNSIVAWWDHSSRDDDSSDECNLVMESRLIVGIIRCCGEREEFDPVAEDADAKCFLDDLFILKTCLACNAAMALEPYIHCEPYVEDLAWDDEKEGGCYSAALSITMSEYQCCPPPIPPPIP